MIWNIVQLERETTTGRVTTVHWSASLTEDDYHGYTYGAIGLPEKDPTDESFIAFEDLTKEQVIEWLIAELGEEQVESTLSSLEQQIETQKNPPVSTGMPWDSV